MIQIERKNVITGRSKSIYAVDLSFIQTPSKVKDSFFISRSEFSHYQDQVEARFLLLEEQMQAQRELYEWAISNFDHESAVSLSHQTSIAKEVVLTPTERGRLISSRVKEMKSNLTHMISGNSCISCKQSSLNVSLDLDLLLNEHHLKPVPESCNESVTMDETPRQTKSKCYEKQREDLSPKLLKYVEELNNKEESDSTSLDIRDE